MRSLDITSTSARRVAPSQAYGACVPSFTRDTTDPWPQVINMYSADADGLPGNEDAGQMSAWLVATMLGFYPVDPTSSSVLAFRPWVSRRGTTKRLACLTGCLMAHTISASGWEPHAARLQYS